MNKKNLRHQDLIKLYKEGDQADNVIYAEQRSNLMLVAGNHYTKKGSRFWNRIREDRGLTQDQRIRLTKNHIQRVCKIYENNILSYAPGVSIEPKNMAELQDQKAAELNNAVWMDIVKRHKFKQKTREFCQDFIRVGEVCAKIYWDETKGQLVGYEQKVDEMGQPMHETMQGPHPLTGQMVEMPDESKPIQDKEKPRFSGDIVIERFFGFNVFRSRDAKSMEDSWFIGLRKMVDVDELKTRVGDDEEKLKYIQASKDETFMIFDSSNTSYATESQNQCLLLEMYIKPSIQFPKGYYYIYTNAGILWEGELPFGVFPIVFTGFDEVPTNPRYHSIIKHLRPYQAEINRMASSAAEAQITMGQDKLITQPGQKIQNGGLLPGIRSIQVSGAPPTILAGRVGDQWLQPMAQAIEEMYQIANLQEDLQEKPSQVDPYTMLFQTIDQKKKYVIYVTKFMQFLQDVAETSLTLMREYIEDEALIPAIGRSEMINIPEFKSSKPLCYNISVESGTEDMESKIGKQLMFNQVIQFAGSQLDKKDLGRMIRTSPYANNEQAFEDMTLDYDNATNMLLALDRGEQFQPNPQDDSSYMMKRLVARSRKADFKQLSPQIQQNYMNVYQQYVQIGAEQAQKIKDAEAGFIPVTGGAVVCDLYVPDPNNKSKQQRVRVPYDSLQWLIQRIEEQGVTQQGMAQQTQQVQSDVGSKLAEQQSVQPNAGVGLTQPQIQA
jgi:hypothetical protein